MTSDESRALGRVARAEVPRSCHAEWKPSVTRTDPMSVLKQQETTRVAELVGLRHERMLVSPFTFYRGAAAIMAADLATTPTSGIRVQCCGDAHLANFGGFKSPERAMVFDINDFDETLPGPWEWDVKRLATSFAIAARDREFDDTVSRQAVGASVRAYRKAMRSFAAMGNLDVWYSRLDVQGIIDRWRKHVPARVVKQMQRNVAKAGSKDSLRAFAKLTELVDGEIRIKSDPPVLARLDEILAADESERITGELRNLSNEYVRTLQPNRRRLLDGYRIVDFARKVVGVGSVGTRCWIMLLLGRDDRDPLFLQVKEAEVSVLEPFVGASEYPSHGQRVVEGQRLMQATSDIFLGWNRFVGFEGVERDYYVRQLWDGKISADLTSMPPSLLPIYAQMCGWTLARAHARSGDRVAIAAYLGSSDVFDRAIVAFGHSYADQNMSDFKRTKDAATVGQL